MRFSPTCYAVFLFLAALIGGSLANVHAQEAIEISAEQIQARLAAAESSTEFGEAERVPIVESYTQTLVELASKTSLNEQLAKLQQQITEVPTRIEDAKREIAELSTVNASLDPNVESAIKLLANVEQDTTTWLEQATQTLVLIETGRQTWQAQLDDARKTLSELQSEPARRADRRVEVRNLELSLQNRIKSFDAEATALANFDDLPQAIEARRSLLQVRQVNAGIEMDAAKKELELYDAAATLLPLRVDAAQRKVSQLEQAVKLYGAEADRSRKNINTFQARTAESEASTRPAELNRLAQENVELTAKRQKVGAAIQTTRKDLEATVKLASQLREQFDRIQAAIGPTAQVTEAVGQILRKNRQDLPNVRKLRDASEARKTTLYDIRFSLIDSEQQLWPLQDMDAKVRSELELLAFEVPADRLKELETDLRDLLQAKKSALEGLKTDLETYYRELANLDFQEDLLILHTESYANFVDQRVMWIRSVPRLALSDVADTGKSVRWLLDTTSWTSLLRSYWEAGIRGHPFTNVLFVIVLLSLAGTMQSNRRRIVDLGKSAKSRLCCDIRITLLAIILSVINASFWSALLTWISWNLNQVGNGSELVRPLAIATGITAFIVFPYALWRAILKPNGLAEAHFQWSQHRLQLLRNSLHWFIPSWVSLIFLFQVLHATENLVYEKSLARFVFLAACIVLTVFLHRLTSPQSGVPKEYLAINRGGWAEQLRWLWHPLLVGIPIVFAILAVLGYQYTAANLMRRVSISAVFLSVVYIGSAAGLRWIMLRRRAISIEHSRKQASESQKGDTDPAQVTDSVGGVTLAENLDLTTVSAQSVRMLRSLGLIAGLLGLYLIWSSVMPALAQLDEVPLFPPTPGSQPSAVATTPTAPGPGQTVFPPVAPAVNPIADYFAISLGQLLGAFGIAVVTFIAVRNIPGFMEIVLLQRLPLDASLRFAITTITRYILLAIGLVWTFGALGIGWGKIQWLVAALSVGLGFGLQEIFANFVSGLILLFERPLRAGDIVTVGDTSGKVIEINTRATTIRDWDRKELIVPNKDFITGKLLNWTLNDTMHRIVICVGIAYGSDVKKAHKTVLDVAMNHPGVLKDPQPSVAFDAFGDSSLNLRLRCFIPNLDEMIPVTHDLHEAIHRELHAAEIEIAFPQRDLHIRSVETPFRLSDSDPHEFITDTSRTGLGSDGEGNA